jgi:rhombotail lipoprotein
MHKFLCLGLFLTAACAASPAAQVQVAPPQVTQTAPAAPLDRSVFARTPQGQLSEDKLQEILDRPLELELPARVGVLPIIEAEDWRGPGPSYDRVSPALSQFAKKLPADDGFRSVTEMMPIPSGALGMEALREIAARYKLRYLLLYREDVERTRRGNGIATGYATVVGAFFLPGSTLEVDGYTEVSLFDVKTGILLFTVRRRIEKKRRSNVWQRERKLREMQETLAVQAATALAKETRTALERIRNDLDAQRETPKDTAIASSGTTTEVGP